MKAGGGEKKKERRTRGSASAAVPGASPRLALNPGPPACRLRSRAAPLVRCPTPPSLQGPLTHARRYTFTRLHTSTYSFFFSVQRLSSDSLLARIQRHFFSCASPSTCYLGRASDKR